MALFFKYGASGLMIRVTGLKNKHELTLFIYIYIYFSIRLSRSHDLGHRFDGIARVGLALITRVTDLSC